MSTTPPDAPDKIVAADLRDKLDEIGSAAQEAIAESQAQLLSYVIVATVAAVWIAYRLGKRRGRQGAHPG